MTGAWEQRSSCLSLSYLSKLRHSSCLLAGIRDEVGHNFEGRRKGEKKSFVVNVFRALAAAF